MATILSDQSQPQPQQPPASKTVLGKYQLGRVLGRGSFAKVYHAKSIKDNKSVAIKVIDKIKTDISIHPRIAGEIFAMRRLKHANILRIHEVMASKGKIYMVMELARGGDLCGKLSRRPNNRFSEPIARKYFYQLVSALHYCHQNGVVHRDIKPDNVLLDEQGNVKLADFGLSAVAQSPIEKDGLLKTSCGTPAFAGPEIVGRVRGGYDGCKADAWSCGIMLFVMLTGYLPFDCGNLVVMYRKMIKREFRFPAWVSKPAMRLVMRLLDPNPKTRMSIEEVVNDPWMIYSRSLSVGDMVKVEEMNKYEKKMECMSLNAFEIISMSSGLDLSGLLERKKEKRFTSRESKGVVVEKVVEVAMKLGYEVEKREKGCGAGLGGCCVWLGKGRVILSVAVVEVADGLIVVEIEVVDGGWGQDETHLGEIETGLGDIVVSWQNE